MFTNNFNPVLGIVGGLGPHSVVSASHANSDIYLRDKNSYVNSESCQSTISARQRSKLRTPLGNVSDSLS